MAIASISRRTLLAAGGLLGGLVACSPKRQSIGDPSTSVVETSTSTVGIPTTAAAATTVAETTTTVAPVEEFNPETPYLTPNERFFRIDTWGNESTDFVDTWSLAINGMVDKPLRFTLAELQAMPQVEHEAVISCVSNYVGGGLVGNARWGGIPLDVLLHEAGVQPGAEQVFCTGIDDFTCGFPVETVFDGRHAMLALTMNGEPLPLIHGYPARLIVPGLYGYVSAAKWITEIRLNRWADAVGGWVTVGWSKEAPVKTQCRIDLPRQGRELAAGPTYITGAAWAPPVGVARVEVMVDGGPWMDAELDERGNVETWKLWRVAWTATPGTHVIRARATDLNGVTQTEETSTPAPSGATGYPTRGVTVSS